MQSKGRSVDGGSKCEQKYYMFPLKQNTKDKLRKDRLRESSREIESNPRAHLLTAEGAAC